jgi:predicted GH43/DUF377 family glycosyl hydrolase
MGRNLLALVLVCFVAAGCRHRDSPPKQTSKIPTPNPIAVAWALQEFTRIDSVNPVLSPGVGSFIDPVLNKKVLWEEKDVFNPAIVNRNGKIYMFYRAQDRIGKPAGTSRIGMAVSIDGFHFTRMAGPVLYPAKDEFIALESQGGCEDPRIVQDEGGIYYMMYTAFDGTTARLFVATSPDLITWKKHGSAFAKAYKGKYALKWSKSGSVVSRYRNGQAVAAKINGKYWMYWGDSQIWCATSDDLVNWTPLEMLKGELSPVKLRGQALNLPDLKVVLPTRDGMFDSDLVEPGPPAMITDDGIVLLYNSRNMQVHGDTSLPANTYSASQVLFDKNDPSKIIHRMDRYFMKPERPYELGGQVDKVCFIEGLTQLKNKWYLYYGTADSKIAVAVTK